MSSEEPEEEEIMAEGVLYDAAVAPVATTGFSALDETVFANSAVFFTFVTGMVSSLLLVATLYSRFGRRATAQEEDVPLVAPVE